MFKSIRTSSENKAVVTELTRKLNLGPENVIARIAFAYSLSKGKKFKPTDAKDSKGKEYNKGTLLGDNAPYYIGMVCSYYLLHKTDKDIPKYIKMHIDHGLELISAEFKKNQNLDGFDFLIDKIQIGVKHFRTD